MAEVMGRSLSREVRRREQALFLGAAAILIVIAVAAPLLELLAKVPSAGPAGLEVLAMPRTWALLARSLVLAAGVTIVAVAIGVPLGILIGRTDVPLRRVLWLLHAFPVFLPPFLSALGWFHWFGAAGLAGSETTARVLFSDVGLIGVLGATFAPIVTSLVALAVTGVDASLEEAARVVARPWKVATRILLPAAASAVALGAVVVYALALSELGVPMFLRVEVFPTAVFARLGGVDFAPGEAFALTLPLVPVALMLVALERRFAARRSFAVLGLRGTARSPLPLGKWRGPAALACVAATAVSVAPIVALAVRSCAAPPQSILEWAGQAPWNGLLAGVAAATLTTIVALVVGHGVAREVRGASVLDGLCML